MNTASGRFAFLSVSALAALACSAGVMAAPSQKALEVLGERQPPATNVQLPPQAKANSAVFGDFNAAALGAAALELTLADGGKITARLQRVARDDRKGTQSWVGTFDDSPGSVLVLSKAKGVVTGFANYKDQSFEIMPAAGGKHLLYAVDSQKLPKTSEPVRKGTVAGDTATNQGYGQIGATTALPASGIVHDVLVVYTAASASRYGAATLESMIQSAVQSANQAYLNSQVGITMNLIGTGQVSVTEGSSMNATLSSLMSDSATANLRNQLGADVVMLISENGDYCGLANLMTSNSTSFAPNAYGVVYSSCLSNQSLAHETGHVQGLMHDRANSSYGGTYPYSYGYARCTSDGTGFRDVMSYPCSGTPRVLVFSNPYVNWNGYPAGIAYETSPSTSAENARTLINNASTVAAFRTSSSSGGTTPTAPAAPTSMAVRSSAYNNVTVGWADNATNETGFKLERSTDGVNFSEIATLGADSTGYSDGSVAARTTYYFRVRAYNSVGTSAYSNTVSVTTPDVPPPPPPAPSSVSATNNGDGTALASWTESATNVTSFEVRREKFDSRRGTWGSYTVAATVPASVLSIVDQTGAGTYRYYVVAANAGGMSAAAGPASVTVTTTTTSSTSPVKGKGRTK